MNEYQKRNKNISKEWRSSSANGAQGNVTWCQSPKPFNSKRHKA